MPDKTIQQEAFAKIIDSCLNLQPSEQLVVLYDESSSRYIGVLSILTIERNIQTTFVFIPDAIQRHICCRLYTHPDETWLPMPIEEALSLADGVLNLVSGGTETLPFRKSILRVTRSNNCRFAHIPGISTEIIELVSRSPFETILEHAELVAWALGGATNATLVTKDSRGNIFRLAMNLEGWKNEPLMSPGLLFPGSWGNLPPGETFCCPEPSEVSGEVCISGSVPGYVIEKGKEVVLTFESGRMVSFDSESNSPAREFFGRAKKKYEQEGDPDWNLFAELGVGLNPAIPALTGNSLYDEKVAGTVHVAIGENTYFGHNNRSGLHADLAILEPTLSIGDRVIVQDGELRTDEMLAYRNSWTAPRRPIPETSRLRVREADIVEVDGQAYRRLCKASRVGQVRMASNEVGRDLLEVTRALSEMENASVGGVKETISFGAAKRLSELLDILQYFECIEVRA